MANQPYRYARQKKLLGQVLKELKLIHEGIVQEVLAVQKKEGGLFGAILVKLKHITEAQLQQGLARQAGLELLDLSTVKFTPDLLQTVDANTARMFGVVPIRREGDK